MAEIVNLRQWRKRADRQRATLAAAANRVRHGLTRAQKLQARLEAAVQARILSGAKLDGSTRDGETPK